MIAHWHSGRTGVVAAGISDYARLCRIVRHPCCDLDYLANGPDSLTPGRPIFFWSGFVGGCTLTRNLS